MAYRALFFALYLTHSILSPIVNIFLPLKKEVVQVTDLSQLDSMDKKSYYPILDFVSTKITQFTSFFSFHNKM